jgi:hypothetical protein
LTKLVKTDRSAPAHVLVLLGQRVHDAILDRVEVLKFVDEDRVPPFVHARVLAGCLEERRRADDERVEVENLPRCEKALVLREET